MPLTDESEANLTFFLVLGVKKKEQRLQNDHTADRTLSQSLKSTKSVVFT
jgi:hypothetical protein